MLSAQSWAVHVLLCPRQNLSYILSYIYMQKTLYFAYLSVFTKNEKALKVL